MSSYIKTASGERVLVGGTDQEEAVAKAETKATRIRKDGQKVKENKEAAAVAASPGNERTEESKS